MSRRWVWLLVVSLAFVGGVAVGGFVLSDRDDEPAPVPSVRPEQVELRLDAGVSLLGDADIRLPALPSADPRDFDPVARPAGSAVDKPDQSH